MGNARFSFTEADLVAAQRMWWMGAARWQTFLKGCAGVGVIYAGIALAATWDAGWPDRLQAIGFAVLVAIGLMLLLMAIGYLLTPRRARKAFREHKALAGEFVCDWDAEGVTMAHDRGTTKMPWAIFLDWMVGPHTVMLFQSSILFNALPRRVLAPGDVEGIVAHLRAAQVPERKRFGLIAWRPDEAEPAR